MGVYIPNMEKPKRCIEELDYGLLDNPCLFVDEREACLLQNNSKIGEYEENYKTCPLIEIDDKEMNGLINLYKICKGTSEVKSIQLKDIKPIVF